MTVQKQKLGAYGFAVVGVITLAAAAQPATKGQSLDLTMLAVGVFWLILSVVCIRKAGRPAA